MHDKSSDCDTIMFDSVLFNSHRDGLTVILIHTKNISKSGHMIMVYVKYNLVILLFNL